MNVLEFSASRADKMLVLCVVVIAVGKSLDADFSDFSAFDKRVQIVVHSRNDDRRIFFFQKKKYLFCCHMFSF